ncbi:tetratricopeptide (TPR) repeat protein [Kitasatospora sp. MAA4]|uniref:tetratricopeptide repeat protein n=1 Tax=Kitasatospora sp. MAA4 TaxID=3035093 RepID=UPI002475DC76|nr:tetratricopeptide repeat protein [Kitasatospora sp. MAA4]MDH6131644.1 tetratricopeptide (TPR) repeat protein [Kitasatospora sp. MAA4]
MSDLARKRNEELARILHQLAWNPERLAREVNLVVPAELAISSTAPYKWRDRGMVPRAPHDQAVCEVLSRAVGIAVTYQQLWGRMGSRRGAKALSPQLLTDPWTADTAQTALREAAADAAPVRLTDLFRGDELALAARHWASPPPPVTGGEGALRIAPEQLTDLRISHDSKWRLEQSCGGGLVLNPAKAELSMVGKLLELGSYGRDEPLGRGLYGAASRLARLVGWADYDMGNEAGAQRAFVAALRAAHVSGDPRLGVSVVGCLAVQATDGPAGRSLDAVAMLDTALRAAEGSLTAGERALQLGRIARAYGRRGERAGAEQAAEQAFAALASERPPHRGQERADLEGMVGEAHLFLGDHERARALLASAVRELTPERARAKALLMVRLADSYRRTGDHEQAAPIADRARRLAAGMQSARVARALRDFDTASRLSGEVN